MLALSSLYIKAPRRDLDLSKLQDRIAIAVNAFDCLCKKFYSGGSACNYDTINKVLRERLDTNKLGPRINVLRFDYEEWGLGMNRCTHLLALSFLLTGLLFGACAEAGPRPTIRVGVGMSVKEMIAGSTYPFEKKNDSTNMWDVFQPYDLTLVDHDRELKVENVGGENYFTAISGANEMRIVDFISITFQSRTLTLDEALAEAKRLNAWFTAGGYTLPAPNAPDGNAFDKPFRISDSVPGNSIYTKPITTYEEARAAFLDKEARIIMLTAFDIATEDTEASLQISNARRYRAKSDLRNPLVETVPAWNSDESKVETEEAYFLELHVSVRRSDSLRAHESNK